MVVVEKAKKQSLYSKLNRKSIKNEHKRSNKKENKKEHKKSNKKSNKKENKKANKISTQATTVGALSSKQMNKTSKHLLQQMQKSKKNTSSVGNHGSMGRKSKWPASLCKYTVFFL
ncbi:hypothetical protein K501DRAFT_301198 [Backusella circina FSU 941]|nr:hypothetical protein K501DRAFT_301198 [Backusella circina FSU 941]